MRSIGSPYVGKGRLRAFFKKPSAKKAGELLDVSRNQNNNKAANKTLPSKRTPI
jgi:hypothetical protein